MKNWTKLAIASIGIVTAIFATHAAAKHADAQHADAQGRPITLGAVYNTSGSQALLDVPSLNGARLAAEAINAAGGVRGRTVELVVASGNSVPDAWSARIDQLLSRHPETVAMFGLSDSDNARFAGRASAAHQRVLVTSGATSPGLPQEVPTYLFLACFGDNAQAAVGAEWAYHENRARNALVLFDPNETYPVLLKDYFIERFKQLGGTISSVQEVSPSAATPSVPDHGNADLIFLSVETAQDAARLIPALRQAGYEGPILGGDGYDAASVWEQHPETTNVYFTTHVYLGKDNPNPRVGRFLTAYAKAHPLQTPTGFAALGYDTVGLLGAALALENEVSPSAILDGLPKIKNYQGVTGTISFDHGSRIPRKSVTILKVDAGKQVFATERMPERTPTQ